MHRSETQETESCADCGDEVARGRDRACAFGPEALLCYACAVRRGAVYDETHDRWLRDPDTSDLGQGES